MSLSNVVSIGFSVDVTNRSNDVIVSSSSVVDVTIVTVDVFSVVSDVVIVDSSSCVVAFFDSSIIRGVCVVAKVSSVDSESVEELSVVALKSFIAVGVTSSGKTGDVLMMKSSPAKKLRVMSSLLDIS